MASIIEKYASEDVTLLQGQTISDGKPSFSESIAAKAIVSDFTQADLDYFGRIQEAARANGAAGLFPAPAENPPGSPALLRLMRSV